MCDHCGCRELSPVALLRAEHDRLRELCGLVQRALAHGDDGTARQRFDDMLAVLGPHVWKEESTLFPMLGRDESLTDHVRLLAGEHAGLYDAVDDLAEPVGTATGPADPGAWRTGVLAILAELDEHMYKEDFGLFPAALAVLDGSDWDAIDRWEAGTTGDPVSPLVADGLAHA
jgi:iron-sulfur cluster repair protein YtfE (RIC family)